MFWTGLIAASVLASGSLPAQPRVQPAAPVASDRAESQDTVCQTRAVTGSRLTHRICRTREQTREAQQSAQRWLGDSRRSGPSVEAIVNPPFTPATPAGPLT
jgi:hypothetical protein